MIIRISLLLVLSGIALKTTKVSNQAHSGAVRLRLQKPPSLFHQRARPVRETVLTTNLRRWQTYDERRTWGKPWTDWHRFNFDLLKASVSRVQKGPGLACTFINIINTGGHAGFRLEKTYIRLIIMNKKALPIYPPIVLYIGLHLYDDKNKVRMLQMQTRV